VLSDQIAAEAPDPERKKRKKDRLRSAWISFAGRIVAQVVGAVATVALGVVVLHKYAAPDTQPASAGDSAPTQRSLPVSASRSLGELSLAVLPLENFSADSGHEYLADGMTEALIADLSKIDGLRVISRTSSMHFKGQRKPLRDIAAQLGVRWIVEGSVARAGRRVRITAQLIDAGTDQHAWAGSYDRRVTDVLALQSMVASTIARGVSAALPPRRQQSLLPPFVQPPLNDLNLPSRRLHPRPHDLQTGQKSREANFILVRTFADKGRNGQVR
jgi:TolB-like protein